MSKVNIKRKLLATNLLDFGQVLRSVSAECLDAHGIPIVTTFPRVCKSSRSECNVPLLRDVF